jgi:hypothetical protein
MQTPDCLPLKCNAPHLEKIHESYYKSSQGHYTFENGTEWLFVPFERGFSMIELRDIYETLEFLNKESNH